MHNVLYISEASPFWGKSNWARSEMLGAGVDIPLARTGVTVSRERFETEVQMADIKPPIKEQKEAT